MKKIIMILLVCLAMIGCGDSGTSANVYNDDTGLTTEPTRESGVVVDVTKPRDTSITLYDTTDGVITSKTYEGVVFNNVFYEAKEYQYGMIAQYDMEGNTFLYPLGGSALVVDTKPNCFESCEIERSVYIDYVCGAITEPDYKGLAWRDYDQMKKFDGWRAFNEEDAYIMANYLNRIVSDTTAQIVLNVISTSQYSIEAEVAMQKVPVTVSTEFNKMKYVCAYDLK